MADQLDFYCTVLNGLSRNTFRFKCIGLIALKMFFFCFLALYKFLGDLRSLLLEMPTQ